MINPRSSGVLNFQLQVKMRVVGLIHITDPTVDNCKNKTLIVLIRTIL